MSSLKSIQESFDLLKDGLSDFVRDNMYGKFTGLFLKKATKESRDELAMEFHVFVSQVQEARTLLETSPHQAVAKLQDLSKSFADAIDRHRAHSKDPLHDSDLPKLHLLQGRIGDTIFGIAPMLPPIVPAPPAPAATPVVKTTTQEPPPEAPVM